MLPFVLFVFKLTKVQKKGLYTKPFTIKDRVLVVEKLVENSHFIHTPANAHCGYVQNKPLFPKFYTSFPPISTEKRYKLINFAPEKEIVEKVAIRLKFSWKILTRVVGNRFSQVNNFLSK